MMMMMNISVKMDWKLICLFNLFDLFPHLLRSPLPISSSVSKQEYNIKINRMWAKIWEGSPRKDRFTQTDPDFPFISFQKRLFKLNRKQTSIIMQLQTKNIPLNFYLKRIGKIDSDKCLKCNGDPENIQVTETINHYLFKCQAYEEARQSHGSDEGSNLRSCHSRHYCWKC